jgi:hypothetical protein
MSTAEGLAALFSRDLDQAHSGIAGVSERRDSVAARPGVKNSAGNLVLHLEGNLREYVGRQLGQWLTVRARDQEFALTGVSRDDLVQRMEQVKELVAKVVSRAFRRELAAFIRSACSETELLVPRSSRSLAWTPELSFGADRLPAANPDGRLGGRLRGAYEPVRLSARLRQQSRFAQGSILCGALPRVGNRPGNPDLAEGNFRNLTLTAQLNVIARVCRDEPVSLIGSSMGGYLAALYAARHAEVKKLVLLAPAFSFASRWPETLGEQAMEQWKRTNTLEGVSLQRGTRSGAGLSADGRCRQYEAYPDFTQPVLIFQGRNDTVVPPEYAETFAARHPNALAACSIPITTW